MLGYIGEVIRVFLITIGSISLISAIGSNLKNGINEKEIMKLIKNFHLNSTSVFLGYMVSGDYEWNLCFMIFSGIFYWFEQVCISPHTVQKRSLKIMQIVSFFLVLMFHLHCSYKLVVKGGKI